MARNPVIEVQTAPRVVQSVGPALLGLGTAVPTRRLEQDMIYEEILAPLFDGNRAARAIFRHAGVGSRHLVVEKDYYDRQRTTGERNERYLIEALRLGADAITQCLAASGYGPESVNDFIVTSCTGIDTPGLDLRLAAQLGMPPDLRRATILGMGCYAALPGLLRCAEAARSGRLALLLALELCSLHFQPRDASTENVVSAALFADGAAAVLVGPTTEAPRRRGNSHERITGPRLLDFQTQCDYRTFQQMGFHLTDHGFQMRLGTHIPDVLAENVRSFVRRLLQRNGLQRNDVDLWAIHPGSARILDKLQAQLELSEDALDASRAVLQRYGNMSSPTILFVLDELRRRGETWPGAFGVVLTFGPGLTLEGALVQW